jgi:methionyl aminopeptidase
MPLAQLTGPLLRLSRTARTGRRCNGEERVGHFAHRRHDDDRAAAVARAGQLGSSIGKAVERSVKADGFSVDRALTGHGVGRTIHEQPTVLNYFDKRQRDVLTEGLVLTIEPIISERPCRVVDDADGWTMRTSNGSLSAHYEETIVITSGAPIVLTALPA